MKILIVEDDPHKSDELEEFAKKHIHTPIIVKCEAVSSAVKTIDHQIFDLVLLDMALPSHQLRLGNGPAVSLLSGGLEIVMEFDYLQRNDPIIILTQHTEVEINEKLVPIRHVKAELLSLYSINLVDCIRYEYQKEAWRTKLAVALEVIK